MRAPDNLGRIRLRSQRVRVLVLRVGHDGAVLGDDSELRVHRGAERMDRVLQARVGRVNLAEKGIGRHLPEHRGLVGEAVLEAGDGRLCDVAVNEGAGDDGACHCDRDETCGELRFE